MRQRGLYQACSSKQCVDAMHNDGSANIPSGFNAPASSRADSDADADADAGATNGECQLWKLIGREWHIRRVGERERHKCGLWRISGIFSVDWERQRRRIGQHAEWQHIDAHFVFINASL